MRDQLEKLIVDERCVASGDHREAANIQLQLVTRAQGGVYLPDLVSLDLTPFLRDGKSFLYYTVGADRFDYASPRTPAELMAASLENDLHLLAKLDATALSKDEWSSLLALYEHNLNIAYLAMCRPFSQSMRIDQLLRVWDMTTELFRSGVQNLGLLSCPEAEHTAPQEPACDDDDCMHVALERSDDVKVLPQRSIDAETAVGSATTAVDDGCVLLDIKPDPEDCSQHACETQMLAIEKYAGQSDAQSKGIELSRFDAHLPVCCRDSKDLDAMVATLIYAVGMMLKYEQHLSKAKKTYLRSVRRAGEDVASGRDFRLIDKLLEEATGVWDACWKIYFDLSEQLGEEDENFLG